MQNNLLKLILKLDKLTATNILHKEINYIKSRLLWSGLRHGYVNFSGHQLDEPTGFSGGLEQQLNVVIWLVKLS